MHPRLSVLTAYERVLELSPASRARWPPRCGSPIPLTSSRPGRRCPTRRPPPTTSGSTGVLDVLQSTSATGLDWTNFSYYACVPSLLYLHGDVWRKLEA